MSIFKHIGIIGRYRSPSVVETVQALITFLKEKHIEISLEQETAEQIQVKEYPVYSKEQLAEHCDLLIVVGGDGSLLRAAIAAVKSKVPVIGINRGKLGFLTDITPQEFATKLSEVLAGHYYEEERFLLTATLSKGNTILSQGIALNDVVLMPGALPHLIEFETYINDKFVCTQRADGLIVATPTGSTAYALSAGGPILYPSLDAMVLVPMFPHKLTSRPIVVKGDSEIKILISAENENTPKVSWDGQERMDMPAGGTLSIKKLATGLKLLHPADHDYFETLRNKLGWEESKV